MFTKLTYNRALPDIWRLDRENEIYIYIYNVYINNIYNLF